MPNDYLEYDLLIGGASEPSYDSDAQAYFTRMGISDRDEKDDWNTLVTGMKSAGLYSKWLAFYPISSTGFGASLGNAISSSFDYLPLVAPSYSPTTGHTYNGTTQVMNTQIIPATHMTNNSWTVFQYSPAHVSGFCTRWGCINGASKQLRAAAQTGSNAMQLNAYDGTALSGASTATSGRFYWTMTASNSRKLINNTTLIANSGAAAGGTIPDVYSMYNGARNNAGTADLFLAGNIRLFGVTNVGLTETECNTMDALIATYIASRGI